MDAKEAVPAATPDDGIKELEALIARVRSAQSTFASFSQEQVDAIFKAAALAANSEHGKVFSGSFMETYGIKNVGSVTKALKRLISDEIIYEFNGEYLFENPFFREWVRRR
jgi:acyl-CoA reductase-like NAD-dependent aldehyde dehydrogenase